MIHDERKELSVEAAEWCLKLGALALLATAVPWQWLLQHWEAVMLPLAVGGLVFELAHARTLQRRSEDKRKQ